MKKKLIEALKWVGFIITVIFIYAIDILLFKTEIFIVCCILMGNAVICVTVITMCQEIFKDIIKFTQKKRRKSENGI